MGAAPCGFGSLGTQRVLAPWCHPTRVPGAFAGCCGCPRGAAGLESPQQRWVLGAVGPLCTHTAANGVGRVCRGWGLILGVWGGSVLCPAVLPAINPEGDPTSARVAAWAWVGGTAGCWGAPAPHGDPTIPSPAQVWGHPVLLAPTPPPGGAPTPPSSTRGPQIPRPHARGRDITRCQGDAAASPHAPAPGFPRGPWAAGRARGHPGCVGDTARPRSGARSAPTRGCCHVGNVFKPLRGRGAVGAG